MQIIEDYAMEIHRVLSNLPLDAINQTIEWLKGTRRIKGMVFLAGNGGSASTAEHFACDLQRMGVRTVCLTSNTAVMTAFSNDIDYVCCFKQQLEIMARPGDGLIAISTSGNSVNIINAVNFAKFRGMYVIGMTGESGGELAKIVDANLSMKSDETDVVEDLHLIMVHKIIRELEK